MPRQLHRYDQPHQLEERREEWIRFGNRCPLAAPFCHPRIWTAWMTPFAEGKPVVYELRDGGELVALLPLYLERSTLHLASDRHLDYQDIAALTDEDAAELLAGVAARKARKGYSLTFEKVAEHSRLHQALASPRLAEVAALRSRYWSICPFTCFEVPAPGRFSGSLSSRQRKDFKAARRRLHEACPDPVVEHEFGVAIQRSSLEQAAALHRGNQYRKKGESVFGDHDFTGFLERQASSGAPLLLSTLREKPGGRALAFALGYFSRDTYYYYLTAYDGSSAELSPGRVLLIEVLAHCADRITGTTLRFDLLCGEESYKTRWATSFYEVTRFQVIPRRLSHLPQLAIYTAVYSLKKAKNRLYQWKTGGGYLPGLRHEPPGLVRDAG
ncbi:MAG: GNAT family N-acetyltransferase [Verrucomicrobiaceae bacterium]|nr:GNAT family N-acetyltransferase [Verrucomicrobiaceae bacterium]